jgi:hypothetical protein
MVYPYYGMTWAAEAGALAEPKQTGITRVEASSRRGFVAATISTTALATPYPQELRNLKHVTMQTMGFIAP